ncbi:MAG: SAM-dependent methyltransferase [Planctomycetota bacterium]
MKTTAAYSRLRLVVVLLGLAFASTCLTLDGYAGEKQGSRYYLVGVGPGDPDLLTLRAIKVIDKADVVFCSQRWAQRLEKHLEGKELHHGYWRLFPYYGRQPSEFEGDERRRCEAITQKRDQFIALVREAVAEGKTVAMLDGGDPLIYGPCAWSLEEFEDLDPVVVPGVSSFNAANAALRRAVTTSDDTKSVILTAADWAGKTDTIEKLAAHQTTMVLFTMRTELREFVEKLAINYPPETPIALVKHAGYADKEEVITSTVGQVLDEIDEAQLPFEYLIYVGDFLQHRYN